LKISMTDHLDEARTHYERRRELLDSGDVAEAIAQFELSIGCSPHFKTLELLGEAFIRNGEPSRAIVPSRRPQPLTPK
jgi:hypothetical protein